MKLLATLKQRWVIWVWQHTPNCAEMSRLASRRLDEPLSLKQRLRMRLHLLICVWCKRYIRQLDFLHHGSARVDEHLAVFPQRGLTHEAKGRIIGRLRAALRM